MKRTTIAIDIDDVIADSTDALRIRVNERIGASLTSSQYHEVGGDYHGYYERVWRTHGLESHIDYDTFDAEMAIDQSHIPLLAGAEFAIRTLSVDYQVVFITARPASWETETRKWFNVHFNQSDVELYFCEKLVNDQAKSKGEICVDVGALWLVDDNVSHCQSALDVGINAILFGNYGWQSDIPDKLIRCAGWPDVLEHLNGRA